MTIVAVQLCSFLAQSESLINVRLSQRNQCLYGLLNIVVWFQSDYKYIKTITLIMCTYLFILNSLSILFVADPMYVGRLAHYTVLQYKV